MDSGPEVISFKGMVTTSKEEFGMVRDDVFFVKSVVKGPFPQVGDYVLVQAEKAPGMPFKYVAKRLQCLYKGHNPTTNVGTSGSQTKLDLCDSITEKNANASKEKVYSPVTAHSLINRNFLPVEKLSDNTAFSFMSEYAELGTPVTSSEKYLNLFDKAYNFLQSGNPNPNFSTNSSTLMNALDISKRTTVVKNEIIYKLKDDKLSLISKESSNLLSQPNDKIYGEKWEQSHSSEELNSQIEKISKTSMPHMNDPHQSYYLNILKNASSHMNIEPRDKLISKIDLFTSLHNFVKSLARKKKVESQEILSNDQICTLMLNPPTTAEKVRIRYPCTATWEPFSVEALLWELHQPRSSTITLSSDSEEEFECSEEERDIREVETLQLKDSRKSPRTSLQHSETEDNIANDEMWEHSPFRHSSYSNDELAQNSEESSETSQTPTHSKSFLHSESQITIKGSPPQESKSVDPVRSEKSDSTQVSKNHNDTNKNKTWYKSFSAKKNKRHRDNLRRIVMEAIRLGEEVPKIKRNRGRNAPARSLARAKAHFEKRGLTYQPNLRNK